MKKITSIILAAVTLMFNMAFAADDISVILNDNKLEFDQPPVIKDDYTLVPFRKIFESLDMTVQWFADKQLVAAQKEGTEIYLYIDSPEMYVNGETISLPVPPTILNDRTLVPLRAVSEAAGAEVSWDGSTRTVSITSNPSSFEDWGQMVLILVNSERKKAGLKPVEWDDSLAALAREHCEDMVNRDFFSHDNPDGLSPFDRMKRAGIDYLAAGENIAAGSYSPIEAMEGWMSSPGHRANILNPDFKSMGVSVVWGGSYGVYWAQEFALLK